MGYYTSYSLQCYGLEDKIKTFEEGLLSISENDCEVKELIETGGVYAKLYDINKWISAIAPGHPDVLICLYGDGEDSDDMWEERWKGNEHELQRSIIPPFKNKNLQIPNNK